MTALIQAKLYAAMLPFAAVKDVREYLKGLYVQPNPKGAGVLIVGTCGSRLFVVRDPLGVLEGPPVILAAIKPPSKTGLLVFDGIYCRAGDGASVPCAFVEGEYPDWQRVIPFNAKPADRRFSAINPVFLKSIDALAKAVVDTPYGDAVSFIGHGPDQSVEVRFESGEAFGVIMPLCGKGEPPPPRLDLTMKALLLLFLALFASAPVVSGPTVDAETAKTRTEREGRHAQAVADLETSGRYLREYMLATPDDLKKLKAMKESEK